MVRFEWCVVDDGGGDASSHSSCRIVDVLDFHRQRVLAANEECHTSPNERQPSPLDSLPSFFSLCPAVRICSFQLVYSPASQSCCAVELAVQCEVDLQLRGFYVARPSVQFTLLSDVSLQRHIFRIKGQACATYSLPGSLEVLECCADLCIYIRAGANDVQLSFEGDSLSMMRMADILSANSGQSRPMSATMPPTDSSDATLSTSPVPPSSASAQLPSFTSLRSRTLDMILAIQLPSLAPCSLPAGCDAVGMNEPSMHGLAL